MSTFNMFLVVIVLAGSLPLFVVGQGDCGCADGVCCSKYGYCGNDDDFCGKGCQAGPCYAPPATNNVVVGDIVSDAFFNGIVNKGNKPVCPGKGFYTRAAFLGALNDYPQFGRVGSLDDSKREIAAFFAHVTHETGNLCSREENDGAVTDLYCNDKQFPDFPCNPNKKYFGRGPLQLSWNYNYGPAGNSIKFDGLNSPETVANDAAVSFKTSLWYWMRECHDIITSNGGFGKTIQAINGNVECGNKEPVKVQSRINFYTSYCNDFGVAPGDNLSC